MSAPRSPDLDGILCPNEVLYFLSALSNLLVQFLFGLASQVWPTKLHMHADWTIKSSRGKTSFIVTNFYLISQF